MSMIDSTEHAEKIDVSFPIYVLSICQQTFLPANVSSCALPISDIL